MSSIQSVNNKNPTKFGKICYAVFFELLAKTYNLTKKATSIQDIFYLDGLTYFAKSLNKKNLMNEQYSFFFHEIFYGKKIGKNILSRNNNNKFWSSHWEFNCSPFRAAQNILSNYGMYLSDDSSLSDKKLKLSLFFVKSNMNTDNLWHKNNTFPFTTFKQNRDLPSLNFDCEKFDNVLFKWDRFVFNLSIMHIYNEVFNLMRCNERKDEILTRNLPFAPVIEQLSIQSSQNNITDIDKVNNLLSPEEIPTHFGKICYCILYHLLNEAIRKYNHYISCHDSYNIDDEIKRIGGFFNNSREQLFEHIVYLHNLENISKRNFSERITYNSVSNDDKKEKKTPSFTLDTFFYGLNMGPNFEDRLNSSNFWKSQWHFNSSPFKVAQVILSQNNIYITETTKKDSKSPLVSFMLDVPEKKESPLWHGNNIFNFTLPKFSFVNDLFSYGRAYWYDVRKEKVSNNIILLDNWKKIIGNYIDISYINNPSKIFD